MDPAKQAAGAAAVAEVAPGMTLGLGSGSTVAYFLDALAADGPPGIRGLPTSEATRDRAGELGIELVTPDEVDRLDLVVDGADELTGRLDLTKGGGGALLREKVVAELGAAMVVVATQDKVVDRLGDTFPLPIEVVPFALAPVRRRLEARGYEVSERAGTTDNGNRILDARWPGGIADVRAEAAHLAGIAGIAEHGLFVGLATTALLGRPDGTVRRLGR